MLRQPDSRKKVPRIVQSVFILLTISLFHVSAQEHVHLDKARLDEIEELSESLANELLELSLAVRKQDLKRLAEFFEASVEVTPFPVAPPPARAAAKWIRGGTWELPDSQPVSLAAHDWLKNWQDFLACYASLEDARFKVSDAEFTNGTTGLVGSSQVKFFLVGRDHGNRRLWIKGSGRLKARQGHEASWLISHFLLDHIEAWTAEEDLFSEVAQPAGLSVFLPSYGSPGNDDFVYHGAAAADVNEDGWIDLFVTGLSQNYLYVNNGDGTFKEAGQAALIPATPQGTAPLWIDYDNDGDLDLFLAAVGTQKLFENRLRPEGKLIFLEVSEEARVSLPAIGFSAAAGDVNNDGWADIYVTSYNRYGRVMPNSWHRATNGTPNLLFVNQKDGTFKEAAAAWGVRDTRWSYAAQFVDLNGDGQQDLYVANDFGENALFINLGDRFEDRAAQMGMLDPGNGMGVAVGDYNNDGHLDLHVTNMSSTAGNRILNRLFPGARPDSQVLKKLAAGNTLFQGLPDGSFADVSQKVGPFVSGWAWGGVFLDFDNDGWQDLLSTNGFISGKTMKDT